MSPYEAPPKAPEVKRHKEAKKATIFHSNYLDGIVWHSVLFKKLGQACVVIHLVGIRCSEFSIVNQRV